MGLEDNKIITFSKSAPAVVNNIQPERFDVVAHKVFKVSQGNVTATLTAAQACANAGLPIEWAAEGLVRGHGCPEEKTNLQDVSVNNIEPNKLGEIIHMEDQGFVAWEMSEPLNFTRQLESGDSAEPLENGLVKVGNQVENIKDPAGRRQFNVIRIVPKEEEVMCQIEQPEEPITYNFGALPLDKAA